MLDNIEFKEIITSLIGGLIALFFAGCAWVAKSAYAKHKREILALAKIERATVINFESVTDNLEFIKKWIDSSSKNRPFNYDFAGYILLEEETYNLSNLKTINEILPVLYRLDRSDKDLKNMYKGYCDAVYKIDSMEDEKFKEENFKAIFQNIQQHLEAITPNYTILQENLKNLISYIRANSKVRKFSLFGFIDFLFKDIYPKVNRKLVSEERKKLEEEIIKKLEKLKKGVN